MEKVEVICLKVCAWCEELIGFTKSHVPKDEAGKEVQISHGMCEKCYEKEIKKSTA
jgi:hypothetical protein